jgi:murein DD-endopeptidase MepM/ murein hydrolase activator NlpD
MKFLLLILVLGTVTYGLAQEKVPELRDTPSISPLDPGERPCITSFYGLRLHPLDRQYRIHAGLDMTCPKGFQLVYATARGRVLFAGYDPGLGLAVTIDHPSGYHSVYGHLSTLYVNKGDEVDWGEVIGLMGQTGKATGIHLHYGLRKDGRWVDPLPYLSLYEAYITKKDASRASQEKR